MKIDLSNQDKLFQYLDQAQPERDHGRPKSCGTPFEGLPKDSLAAIISTRELAQTYVKDEDASGHFRSGTNSIGEPSCRHERQPRPEHAHLLRSGAFIHEHGAGHIRHSIALVVALQLIVSRSITKPLIRGMAFAELVASGDFRQQLPIKQKDEIGKLAEALNTMCTKLRTMVGTVQESAEQVASSSEQITASAQQLAEGAQSQASSLEDECFGTRSAPRRSTGGRACADTVRGRQAGIHFHVPRARVHRGGFQESRSDRRSCRKVGRKRPAGAMAVTEVVDGVDVIAGRLGEDQWNRDGDQRDRRPNESPCSERVHRGWPGPCSTGADSRWLPMK